MGILDPPHRTRWFWFSLCFLVILELGAGQAPINPRFPPPPPPPAQPPQQPPFQPQPLSLPPPPSPSPPGQPNPNSNQGNPPQQPQGGVSQPQPGPPSQPQPNQQPSQITPSKSPPQHPLPPQPGFNTTRPFDSNHAQEAELSRVKDEKIRRVLMELASPQHTDSQLSETQLRLATLVGPLFIKDFELRKDQVIGTGKNDSQFPERILSAVMEIQGEDVKAHLLQRDLTDLRAADFGSLPVALQISFLNTVLSNLTGTMLAAPVRANWDDTLVAYKMALALQDRRDQQDDFLQSLGGKITPDVQKIVVFEVLKWWGDPNQWKDRELSLLTAAGDPLISYLPPSCLQTLDPELADRFINVLGSANEIGKVWWKKSMNVKKVWFELAKGARYFGDPSEWSFRRMQKLSFLLEGASPDDLAKIPGIAEIKPLIIGNNYNELQARVVFDAFYPGTNLNQEDLNEFQQHILKLTPSQIQRFDISDTFSTLDDTMNLIEHDSTISYPAILQMSFFMWPIVNSTQGLINAPVSSWSRRELSQIGKMLFTLPKSTLLNLPPGLITWDSNILPTIRSNQLSRLQIWSLTQLILGTIDERFKSDYIFMIPSPFQRGIPSQNISQILLRSGPVRPEVLQSLFRESGGMLRSQQAVVAQRIRLRFGEPIITRQIFSSDDPSQIFGFMNPRQIVGNIRGIIKTITDMEEGRFEAEAFKVKLLPPNMLSIWLDHVRNDESSGEKIPRWTADDLHGDSAIGMRNKVNFAVLGMTCEDLAFVAPLDIPSVLQYFRNQIYKLRAINKEVEFPMNLRICGLERVLLYLEQKNILHETSIPQLPVHRPRRASGDEEGSLLNGLNYGDIKAIGGEVLSAIPNEALLELPAELRQQILEEIGQLEMLDLFSFAPLKQLQFYGNLLLNDIHRTNATSHGHHHHPDSAETILIEPASGNLADPLEKAPPLESETVLKMGNLLCYANNVIGDGNWSKIILKDVLEGKMAPGEKTCCMPNFMRDKWFSLLQTAYGSDPESWNENDLVSIGDLLVALPAAELQKISLDAWGKAVSPMVRQTGFSRKIRIPGQVKRVPFIRACMESLGGEGDEFFNAYRNLMKRTFQAAQWIINSVKPTVQLINDEVSRSGRLPRWAESSVEESKARVKRQISINTGAKPQPDPSQTPPPPAMSPQMTKDPQQMGQQQQGPPPPPQTTDELNFPPPDPNQIHPVSPPPLADRQDLFNKKPNMQQQQMQQPQGPPPPPPPSRFGPPPMRPPFQQQQQQLTPSQFGQQQPILTTPPPNFPQQPQQPQQLPSGSLNLPPRGLDPAAAQQQPLSPPFGVQQPTIPPPVDLAPTPGSPQQKQMIPTTTPLPDQTLQPPPHSGDDQSVMHPFSESRFETMLPPPQDLRPTPSPGTFVGRDIAPQQQQQPGFNRPGLPQQGVQAPVQPGIPQQQPGNQFQGPGFPQQQPGGQFQPPQQAGILQPGSPQFPQRPGSPQQSGGPQPRPGQPPFAPNPAFPPNKFPQTGFQPQPVQQPFPNGPPGPGQPFPNNNVILGPPIQPSNNNASNPLTPNTPTLDDSQLNLPARAVNDTDAPPPADDGSSTSFGGGPEVSCFGIKAAGPAVAGLSIEDLGKMSTQDLFDCIETLGGVEWEGDSTETRFAVLKLIKSSNPTQFDTLDSLKLLELGNLVSSLSFKPEAGGVSDISKLNLTIPNGLDILSILGSQVIDPEMLKTIAEKFNTDNRIFPGFAPGIARPDNLRIAVISLQNIICGFTDKIVNSIFESDATLFLDASPTLGILEGCGSEVLTTLATHAVRPSNYGPPRSWTKEDVNAIGVVFAGLRPDTVSSIPPESMSGVTPLAIRSTPTATLQALSPEQIGKLSYMTGAAILKDEVNSLSSEQKSALKDVLEFNGTTFNIGIPPELMAGDQEPRDVGATNETSPDASGDDHEVTIEEVVDEDPKSNGSELNPKNQNEIIPTSEDKNNGTSDKSKSRAPSITHLSLLAQIPMICLLLKILL